MKKTLILIICTITSLSVAAQKELTILHTNDTHSCIFPLAATLADTALADRGGYLRRVEAIKQERSIDPDLLLFDSGDFSQGSPYYSMYKGDVEIKLMNRMRYDAATIGNHEFDFGLDNMARIFRMAQFPIVCANYDFTGTVAEDAVKPYVVIKRKGLRIGVFGLSPALDGLVDPKNCPGVKFLDPVETAKKMVTILRNEKKCDIVICLSHLGWLNDDTGDQNLISKTKGIDLVLGGHSHTYFEQLRYIDNTDGKAIPDDQNGKHAIYVGKMKLKFEKGK